MRIYDSSQLAHVAKTITLHASLPPGHECKHCGALESLRITHQRIDYERHETHGDIAVISESAWCAECTKYWTYRYLVSMAEQAKHGL